MILVDTSVWIDHLRAEDVALSLLLRDRQVLLHPFVFGELALGLFAGRDRVLSRMEDLPSAKVARPEEVFELVEQNALAGSGVGYVDAHLLTSARLISGTRVWTRDKRLVLAARRLGVGETLH